MSGPGRINREKRDPEKWMPARRCRCPKLDAEPCHPETIQPLCNDFRATSLQAIDLFAINVFAINKEQP